MVEGKRSYEFIADSLFEMTTDLSGRFTTTTFPLFAENKYKKKFAELTENEKATTWKEYNEWKVNINIIDEQFLFKTSYLLPHIEIYNIPRSHNEITIFKFIKIATLHYAFNIVIWTKYCHV